MVRMKLTIIGAGYVGLVTGVCLASRGIDVTCVEMDKNKVQLISSGKSPIYEKGLDEMLEQVLNKQFKATHNLEYAARTADAIMICTGTPSLKDGSIDTQYVEAAVSQAGMINPEAPIIIKSTVVPGTTEKIMNKTGLKNSFGVNPEFLKEGVAIYDFMNPDRIVIGHSDERSKSVLEHIYSSFNAPKVFTTVRTAEMIKYASNAFLATKISFMNELGNMCKELGIDTYSVADGMGYDKRIGRAFLNSGIGFGGSCFPKDVRAILAQAKSMGINLSILDAVMIVNESQPGKLIKLAEKHMALTGKRCTVLGLAFKPDTDDVRESSSIRLVEDLVRKGAIVTVYDPKAMENASRILPMQVRYATCPEDAVAGAEIIFITTEWDEFKSPSLYEKALVLDGRRTIYKDKDYEGVCW
jgi:UDPglucose 6-dehydrogenase